MMDEKIIKNIKKILLNKTIKVSEEGVGKTCGAFLLAIGKRQPVTIQINTNFRVRTEIENLLSFDDLFLDLNQDEFTNQKYRLLKNIDNSFLKTTLNRVNNLLTNSVIKNIEIKEYGDMIIETSNGLFLEIISDSHMIKKPHFTIFDEDKKKIFELNYIGNSLCLDAF